MKILDAIRCAALAAVLIFISSCTAPTAAVRRFHEDASVNVVLRFYTWDTIYMTRPDTREGGYLPLLRRDEVAREVTRRQVPLNLAVVVIGSTYRTDQIAQLARDWKQLLLTQGFHRVVVLRSDDRRGIDGLPVIDDSAIAGINDTPESIVALLAPVPSAAGADAAHSPIIAN